MAGEKIKKRMSLLNLYIVMQFFVNQDPAAVLTYHHFLMLLDLALFLWRNIVEATTAGISFDRHYCQSIAVASADLLVAGKQS